MAKNDLDDIVNQIVDEPAKKKSLKSRFNLYLNHFNYITLQKHCKKHKKAVGEVVDLLIAAYLERLEKRGELDEDITKK